MDTKDKFVITINREIGSGGRTVGKKLAEKLGVKFYDKVQIEAIIKQFHLSVDEIEKIKGTKKNWWVSLCEAIVPAPTFDYKEVACDVTSADLFKLESHILKDIAGNESCVIAGRAGFFILKDNPNKISVFLWASMEKRIARLMNKQKLSRAEAKDVIERVDKGRENYTLQYSGSSRYDARNYDLVINMEHMSEDEAVDLILSYIR